MPPTTIGRTIGHGALAGTVAGATSAAGLYWLVEPSIRNAVALEEAVSDADHTHTEGHAHEAAALVSRDQQVMFGLITVLLVGILIGIAFALLHRLLGSRLSRGSAVGSVMLAGLGFLSFTLVPAIVLPANPPGVGDPDTVNLRTLTYLGTIAASVALTVIVIVVARAKNLSSGSRVAAATAVGILGTVALVWAIPNVSPPVPARVPAELIWDFRIGSLAQLGLMWLVLGAGFAYLLQLSDARATRTREGAGGPRRVMNSALVQR
ncbi:CbtA family protein [Paenarthrobacter nitroguajacolicus]|uniref:CbtA family protein n=1 Tax=Paenarthrobacter nitroguajacolicus TaxID=211146 RepID=UPI00248B670C|nr:CbtA family protein [Paenarthrobacter nitroguajacolicus]MDI2037248.1 hypothetical protein [Paenarthrobacter nitroguajacolicus]